MSFLRTGRGVVLLVALLGLLLFLVRPGAGGLKTRIVRCLSQSLGRPVDVGSVSLRFLPPGFDLSNVVVHEDPAFGVEPILRSPQVTASIRLWSLLRGHLDIARLDLSEPSLNLVRAGDGSWNVGKLLERSAETVVAPTPKVHASSGPSFPYIEADHARINLKIGQEKKSFALSEAGFSIWQDSTDSWSVRLKAQPIRTDVYMTDTGLLRVAGTWSRASTLADTPLQMTATWEGAQLGQITTLVAGRDQGWRGGLTLSSKFSGKPSELAISLSAQIEDFRRYDVRSNDSMTLRTTCEMKYSSESMLLSDLSCSAPVSRGQLKLAGNLTVAHPLHAYDLELSASGVPLGSVAALLIHAGQGLPPDLIATGILSGELAVRSQASKPVWTGAGTIQQVTLTSKSAGYSLEAGGIPLRVNHDAVAQSRLKRANAETLNPARAHLDVGPVALSEHRPSATLLAQLDATGYGLSIAGQSDLADVIEGARLLGVRVPKAQIKGSAVSDLHLAGHWHEKGQFNGTVRAGQVRVEVPGLSAPLQIVSAMIAFQPDHIHVGGLTATAGKSTWQGSLDLARGCAPRDCWVQFDLHSPHVSLEEVSRILNPAQRPRAWYQLGGSEAAAPSPFLLLRAKGRLTVDALELRNVHARQVSSLAELDRGKLSLTRLRGNLLGGKHLGNWSGDFTSRPPEYIAEGDLEHISLDKLSTQMNQEWISGSAAGTYHVHTAGYTLSELVESAKATLKVTSCQGVLRTIVLPERTDPLAMRDFTGQLSLRKGTFEIKDGKLETPAGNRYSVSGTASLNRRLDLRFEQDKQSYTVSGPLAQPTVIAAPASATRAALKP